MESASPFAEMPATPESIISQVRQQLSADYAEAASAAPTALDQNVENVVRDLWQGRVKTFVPVLALREVRELLREQEGATVRFENELAAPARERQAGEPARDTMRIEHDVMRLDASDVLRL